MCLPIPRRPGGSRRAEFDVSCDSDVQVTGHVRINGMLSSWSIESIASAPSVPFPRRCPVRPSSSADVEFDYCRVLQERFAASPTPAAPLLPPPQPQQ